MIDKITAILIALVIISITSITITMIVSQTEVPKELEAIEKQVDNNIESVIPIIIEEPTIYIITESLKGFNSIKGEFWMITIDYWFMYDAPNRSSDLFELTLSVFNESTGQYIDIQFEYEEVTEDGLLTAYSPDLDAQVVMYYQENFDDSKIVIMDIFGANNMENTLYFLTTPIFLVETEIEQIEDKEIIAGFTAEELIELGKIILPLLI